MCLGSGGSSKPALQQRTLPAEGVRPADESTTNPPKIVAASPKGTMAKYHPQAKTWDDVDAASPSSAQDVSRQISDSGINF